jgi:MFS family permease
VSDAFRELGSTAVAFIKAPRALWGINVPYVIEGLVYFGILTILGKYCSEKVLLSDIHAGWVNSAVTAGITLAMLFLGGVSDKIGVRQALALAVLLFVVGRGRGALSGTVPLGHGIGSPMFFVMAAGLLITVVAYGLYQPAAYAGVKRYTNPQTAAMGYAVVYGLLNLGAFFSGFVSPIVRHRFEHVFPPNGLSAVFWTYTLLCVRSRLPGP